jgi:hypothetical protein
MTDRIYNSEYTDIFRPVQTAFHSCEMSSMTRCPQDVNEDWIVHIKHIAGDSVAISKVAILVRAECSGDKNGTTGCSPSENWERD